MELPELQPRSLQNYITVVGLKGWDEICRKHAVPEVCRRNPRDTAAIWISTQACPRKMSHVIPRDFMQ